MYPDTLDIHVLRLCMYVGLHYLMYLTCREMCAFGYNMIHFVSRNDRSFCFYILFPFPTCHDPTCVFVITCQLWKLAEFSLLYTPGLEGVLFHLIVDLLEAKS